jgi:peptidyl-prolyl cis-trans isomerase SurA
MTARPNSWMLLVLLALPCLHAQAPAQQPTTPPAPSGVLVDQVIAVVNGDLVLESDVDEERRFQAFQPISDPSGKFSREQAIERLIDRTLILQQARLQPSDEVTLDQARADLKIQSKQIPACKQYDCDTEAGWKKFVEAQGFTVPEVEERWRQRMQIIKFVELRFRAGITITPDQIKKYYDDTLLPEYKKQNATPAPLDSISDRIQEILLQQQVTALIADWLQSLKAQGTVRFMKPGEVNP